MKELHETTWIDLKCIILSERSHTQKTIFYINTSDILEKVEAIGTDNSGCQGWRVERGVNYTGAKGIFLQWRNCSYFLIVVGGIWKL